MSVSGIGHGAVDAIKTLGHIGEKGLQKIMLNNKMIGFGTYCMNCFKRFVVQVLMPNRIRGWIFRKFARNK